MKISKELRKIAKQDFNTNSTQRQAAILIRAAEALEKLDHVVTKIRDIAKKTNLEYYPAKLKKNWVYPKAPRCVECDRPFDLVAVSDANKWILIWDERCVCGNDINVSQCKGLVGEEAWPWSNDYVFASDWESIGIRVEVA